MDPKEIRETITNILDKLEKNGVKSEKQKKPLQEMAQKLLNQLDGENRSIERLYFSYLILDFLNTPNLDEKRMKDFIGIIFPSMLKKRQAVLISQIISLALTLRHPKLLDCMESYVTNCDAISFPSVPISVSLARDSPLFCAAVISRGYFTCNNDSKENLTEWLRTLIDLLPNDSIVLNQSIRFSFLERPTDYELHLVILNVIKNRKCQTLNNHFLIDLATVISHRNDNKILIDRFAQMLIIAYANNMCSQSNQLKNILLDKFTDNILIKAVCK